MRWLREYAGHKGCSATQASSPSLCFVRLQEPMLNTWVTVPSFKQPAHALMLSPLDASDLCATGSTAHLVSGRDPDCSSPLSSVIRLQWQQAGKHQQLQRWCAKVCRKNVASHFWTFAFEGWRYCGGDSNKQHGCFKRTFLLGEQLNRDHPPLSLGTLCLVLVFGAGDFVFHMVFTPVSCLALLSWPDELCVSTVKTNKTH